MSLPCPQQLNQSPYPHRPFFLSLSHANVHCGRPRGLLGVEWGQWNFPNLLPKAPTSISPEKTATACSAITVGSLLPNLSAPASHFQPPETDFLPNLAFSLSFPGASHRPQDSLSLPNPLLQSSLGGPSACPSLHDLMTLGPAPTRAQTMDPILLVCSPDTPAKPGSTHPEFFHTHVLPSAWNAPSYPSSESSSSAAAPQEPSQLAWLKAAGGLSLPWGILPYA